MDVHTLQNRFRSGWTVERALTVPVRSRATRRTTAPSASLSAGTIVKNMMRADLAQQRELTRMLRQFSRDFAMIMERSMHRGVVDDLAEKPSDRSLSVAQDLT
ncbi:hypothetical protein [Tardiphaga sp.]|uniref:hypothetical protein n=1 Tax=Tardiphaga sp. TaxID=1926292 RepID=UPI00261F13E9|nr:hypothetical protein [Tardiphaga sp.]